MDCDNPPKILVTKKLLDLINLYQSNHQPTDIYIYIYIYILYIYMVGDHPTGVGLSF